MTEKRIDVANKVFHNYRSHSLYESLYGVNGFVWDEYRWLNPTYKNYDFGLPTNWDPSTSNLPDDYFQSGVGRKARDCKVVHIVEEDGIKANISRTDCSISPSWQVGIETGFYYINSEKRRVYSDDVFNVRPIGVGEELIEEDFTTIYLPGTKFEQDSGLAGAIFTRSSSLGTVSPFRDMRGVAAFTRQVKNGHRRTTSLEEGDGELEFDLDMLDQTKYEFILYNLEDDIRYSQIPLGFIVNSTSTNIVAPSYTDIFDDPRVQKVNKLTLSILEEGEIVVSKVPGVYKEMWDNEKVVRFSREDLFLVEKDSLSGLYDVGDYYIKTEESGTLFYIVVEKEFLEDIPYKVDLGTVTFSNPYFNRVVFNNNYVSKEEIRLDLLDSSLIVEARENGPTYFLSTFPYLDNSSPISLDTINVELLVGQGGSGQDGKWTRVTSLTDIDYSLYTEEEDLQNIANNCIYIFDSLNGVVYLGSNPGEDATLLFTAFRVPVIYIEPVFNTGIFHERRYNSEEVAYSINPVLDSRGKFIALSDTSGGPYTITLEVLRKNQIAGMEVTTVTADDADVFVVATVKDSDDRPVPNALVDFSTTFGLLSPTSSRTNSAGRAMANYLAPWSIDDFGLSVYYYNTPDYTEEGEAARTWPPSTLYDKGFATHPFTTTYQTRDTFLLDEAFGTLGLDGDTDVSNIYMFIVAATDELQPYDCYEREGGKIVVYYREKTPADLDAPYELIPCLEINVDEDTGNTEIVFDGTIPSSYPPDLVGLDPTIIDAALFPYLQKAVIIGPQTTTFEATTSNSYGETIISNQVTISTELALAAKGVWTLPNPDTGVWDGSKISAATYIILNP